MRKGSGFFVQENTGLSYKFGQAERSTQRNVFGIYVFEFQLWF